MQQEPTPPTPQPATTQPSTDHIGEDTQQCRRVLLNLVEMGNELAAMIAEQGLAQKDNPAEARKSVAAYNAITKSVRRSVMLHDKLGKPRKAPANRTASRKRIIREVEDAIDSQADGEQAETLHAEFLERLDSADLEDDLANRPTAEIITDICRDLGLGIAALPETHPWKRRTLHDIAILNARAEQRPGQAPSEKLAALLATAPPPRPPPRGRSHSLPDVSRMSTAQIEARLKFLRRYRDPPGG